MVLKVHRHWWFIVTRIIGLIGVGISPLVGIWVLQRAGALELAGSGGALVALWAMWLLVLWVAFWQFWTTYYMDIWVVTNKRIIDIDYQRLFDRNIATLNLDRVQDITTEVSGILPTFLKYGRVVVQTAGQNREFVIDQIADPERLRDAIAQVAPQASSRGGI